MGKRARLTLAAESERVALARAQITRRELRAHLRLYRTCTRARNNAYTYFETGWILAKARQGAEYRLWTVRNPADNHQESLWT